MLIGRGAQRAVIDRVLATAAAGRNAAVALAGAPGIGKTALLEYAARRAGGMTVLRARGIESEAQIPFASLLELLRPALPMLGQLSAPQTVALEQAFALRPGLAQDRFAVGAATLGLVAACADERPVLLLLDDIQWFDAPSSEALRFALRRFDADPVAAILAVREQHSSLLDGTDIETVQLEGLSVAEARVLRADLPDALAERLVHITGGNPLALLELTADPDELALTPEGAPVVVSTQVSAAYVRRVAALGDGVRRCLLLAATSDTGDLQLLGRAARLIDLDIDALLEAEAAGLVRISAGAVEFQHPLIRSAVYSDATVGARREAHRALAGVLPDHELDRRAWHLAAAAAGTDETAAAALEHAGRHSLERGGYASAAAAFERAARLTGETELRAKMLVHAAEAAWDAGAGDQARALLDQSRATRAADRRTAFAIERLAGRIAVSHGPVMQGHAILTAAASELAAEPGGAEEAVVLLADAAVACFLATDAEALATTAASVEAFLPAAPSPAIQLLAATISGINLILTGDAASGARALRDAVAISDEHAELLRQQALLPWMALGPLFLRESERVHARLETALHSAREHGGIGTLPFVLNLIARDQATTDRWRLADATYREAVTLARETDQRTWLAFALSGLAWLLAREGRADECQAHAEEALQLAEDLGARLPALWSLSALGDLELALGQPEAAIEQFERQHRLAQAHTISDVDLWPAAELVEAYVRLGREGHARALTTAFHAAAGVKGQPWSLARAMRCEAMIAPNDAFAELFEAALRYHQQTLDAFELARTRLAYGERLRRARNRVLARIQLRAAEEIFTALDARPWAERARAELEATGETLRRGEPNTIDELTPQELQIAMMLASGRTTRETAAALFLSPKTIEYHLRHAYLKLDIHSREELAQVLQA
ncbi:MAG TPA: AAA family ATPase [Solirubrobacteraceae bacterium]|nr:AAA family ATPase [Solirubrobacteraceae bacterium]